MTTRLTWSAVLSIILIPMLAIGWLDPLEGLPLVVLGVALLVTVRLLSKVRMPKITWISLVVVAGIMILTVTLAALQWPLIMAAMENAETDATVGNALTEGFTILGIPVVNALLWVARAADLVMVAGLIVYSVRIFQARKSSKNSQTQS